MRDKWIIWKTFSVFTEVLAQTKLEELRTNLKAGNRMRATSEAGTACTSGIHEFTTWF